MNYWETVRAGHSIRTKISEQLQSLGYQDMVFDGFGVVQAQKGYEINLYMSLRFWYLDFGFELSISDREKTKDLQNFVLVCTDMIGFIKDKAILRTDYTVKMAKFIATHISTDMKMSSPSVKPGLISAQFFGKYCISLQRINVDQIISDEQNDEWLDDEDFKFCESDYDDLKSNIINILNSEPRLLYEKCEFSFVPDKVGIAIYKNSLRYNLHIQSYCWSVWGANFDDMVKAFKKVIDQNLTDFLEALNSFADFHLYRQNHDSYSAVICDQLEPYEVTVWLDVLEQNNSRKVSLLPVRRVDNFDDMEGREFELYCSRVLAANGFEKITLTKGSGDQGIDIVAYKNAIRYGIQCKCYSGDVGNHAVQETLAGKTYYNCDVGVVLTNRYFTKQAIELAEKSRIRLWDRNKLLQMIDQLY